MGKTKRKRFKCVRMVVSPLWRGSGNIHPGWKILPTRMGFCSNTNGDRRFQFEDSNAAIVHVQPHYHYCVRHQLGEVARHCLEVFERLSLWLNNKNRSCRKSIPKGSQTGLE